jgi:tyrosine-protein phosphatase YwqE
VKNYTDLVVNNQRSRRSRDYRLFFLSKIKFKFTKNHIYFGFIKNNTNLLSFFKKNAKPSLNFSVLQVDMHSHLIPGIDDGAKTVEKSVTYIKALQELGFKKIITTPHIMGEYYPNTPATILAGLEQLKIALAKENITLPITVAAEYFVDDFFVDLLDTEAPLLTLPNNQLLIEFSTFAPPANFQEILFRLKTMGYQPILAHPERYVYYANQVEVFQDFKSKGCALQVNLLSLIGHYGGLQKKLAHQLLKARLIDYAGTDLHHGGHIEELKKMLKNRHVQKLLMDYQFKNRLLWK